MAGGKNPCHMKGDRFPTDIRLRETVLVGEERARTVKSRQVVCDLVA
jgi:hypothetical protein